MQSLMPVPLHTLGISNEDLAVPVGELRLSLADPETVEMVLREAVPHLRAAAKSQLLVDLGLPPVADARADLAALSPARVGEALFSAFLAEAVLRQIETDTPDAISPSTPH